MDALADARTTEETFESAGGIDQETVEVVSDVTQNIQLLAPLASSLSYTIRDARGSLMPGRLTLRGIGATKNPDFGVWERAEGVRNVVYSGTGEGEIQLPPGKYRVIVTRGFEYSIFEKQIEVARTTNEAPGTTNEDPRTTIEAPQNLTARCRRRARGFGR